jgi:Uma2 family endonuclease
MVTADQTVTPPAAGAGSHQSGQAVVLSGVSWEAYVGIGELLRDQPVRLNYLDDSLEITTLSFEHELLKKLLGRLVETLTEELGIDAVAGGSTTMRRQDRSRGLEPDECYWVAHEMQMRGRGDFDPAIDPPPDLAIEIEVSRGLLNRREIYASLRIPEVWLYDGRTVRILLLSGDGTYAEAAKSQAFPFFPVADLARFLQLRATASHTDLVRQFRSWVREQVAAGVFPKPCT